MSDTINPTIVQAEPSAPASGSQPSEAKLNRFRNFNPSQFLGGLIDACVMGLMLLVPLWFLPITLDVLELSKQTLLVIVVLVALVAWIGKSIADKAFSLSRSWMHLVVIFFLIGYALTSYMSSDKYLSFVGNVGQMQWAFVTIATLALLYGLIVNRYKEEKGIFSVLLWFLLGSTLSGLYSVLHFFGVPLLNSASTSVASFNPIGTVNALGSFLVIPTLISLGILVLEFSKTSLVFAGKKPWVAGFWKGVVIASLVVSLLVFVMADFWVVWMQLIVGSVLLFLALFLRRKFKFDIRCAIITGAVVVVSIIGLIFQLPALNKDATPSEVSPSASHTWGIAKQTLRDAPLFGTGPGTWMYDYAKYRPIDVNATTLWTVRFERGMTAFLTMVAMLGIIGTGLWILLVASGLFRTLTHVLREQDEERWKISTIIGVSWISILLLAFFYNYNVAHQFAFWVLLALLSTLSSKKVFVWKQETSSWLSSALSVAIIVIGMGAFSGIWLSVQRLVADARFTSAVISFQGGKTVDQSIAMLDSAIAMNPLNDSYFRNRAQAYILKVDEISQGEESKERNDDMNAKISLAIEDGLRAVRMNPANVDNHSNLANIYRLITSFTSGADQYAMSSFENALKLEPSNPVFMDEIGKLHVLRSDAYRTKLQSTDEAEKKDAQANVDAELGYAADWFNKALSVKADYASSRYNLGLVYERQNRLDEAITKLEEVLALSPTDSGLAFQLAILYYRAEKKDAALSMFEQIVAMEPNYADARWFLAALYEEDGEFDKAIEQVKKVEELNPGNETIEARLTGLENKKNGIDSPVGQTIPVTPVDQAITTQTQGANPIQ